MLPVISVCVQTFNHKRYISKCIEGILSQETKFLFEIIIGEDESSDGTREICMDYAKQYPDRIRLFKRKRENVQYINGKPSGRYNLQQNLKECNGKYIALCEGDDYWTDSNKLQKQFDLLETNLDAVLCGSNALVTYEGETESHLFNVFPRPSIKEITYLSTEDFITEEIPLHTSTIIFRNHILKWPSYHTQCNSGDLVLMTTLSLSGKVVVLPDVTAVYHRNAKSITNAMAGVADSWSYIALFKGVDNQTNGAYQNKIRHLLSKYYFQHARSNWAINNKMDSITSVLNSIWNSPIKFSRLVGQFVSQKIR